MSSKTIVADSCWSLPHFLFLVGRRVTNLVATAQGSLLWHQPPDSDYCAVIDQEIPDYNIFSTYLVSDVSFNFEVTIDSVTVYFTDRGQGTWLDVTQGVLNIFEGDALTSEDDPASFFGGDHGTCCDQCYGYRPW